MPLAHRDRALQDRHASPGGGAGTADSVRQTDERSHVRGSLIRQCYGDEPGVGGGVTSGTRGAECEPKTWSSSVRAEGRPMVRHDDEWWMNHRNTYGRLTYVKDATSYETPDTKPITPRMERASSRNGDVRQNEASGEKSITSQLAFQFPIGPRVMPRLPGLGPRVGPQPVPRVPPRLAPRPGPEPGPEPQPSPPRLDPGLRISGCRSELICFDPGKYDEIEYRRQLKIQQDGINAKSSCKNKNDIERYDNFTPQEKRRQRERADYENDEYFTPNYLLRHPGFSMNGKDALHRIDMVAGGYEKDFADMGDSKINQSIGPSWRADSRKGKLKRYADEMCSKGCRMSVTIDICESVPDNGQIA